MKIIDDDALTRDDWPADGYGVTTIGSLSQSELEAMLDERRSHYRVSEIYTRVWDGQKIGPVFYWGAVQYYAYVCPKPEAIATSWASRD